MKPLMLAMTVLLTVAAHGRSISSNATILTDTWRTDPIWYDGQAEIAIYDATRNIYGQPRDYTATFMTNKERLDPQTGTKAASNDGIEVFKFHQREDIPTDVYAYHFSTMAYIGTDDALLPWKLDMSSQEDCGASMKRMIVEGDVQRWDQYSYFPGEGFRELTVEHRHAIPADALPLVLRGYPFGEQTSMELLVVPDQTTNKWSPVEPAATTVTYIGRKTLDLPIGEVEAHHLRVTGEATGTQEYWFAADPAMLHVMLQHEGPGGQSYRLRQVQRDAYWR